MRIVLTLLLMIATDTVMAQRLGSRAGQKPGEVITRPDLSQGMPGDRLEIGKPAPEFTLPLLKAEEEVPKSAPATKGNNEVSSAHTVSLATLHFKKPAVLVFGSMTCPPFRGQLEAVDDVYADFRDRAEFLFIYVRKAHPDSILSVRTQSPAETLLKITQAASLEERASTATVCQRTMQLKMPIAVDAIDNKTSRDYAGWPNRCVVVDRDGKVIFKTDVGPGSTNAQRLRTWLSNNLPGTKN